MFTSQQATLKVASQAVSSVSRFEKYRHTLSRFVFHTLVIMNIAEQEIVSFFPPYRPLGWTQGSAETVGQLLDRFRRRNHLVELRGHLLDFWLRRRLCAARTSGHCYAAHRNSHCQRASA